VAQDPDSTPEAVMEAMAESVALVLEDVPFVDHPER
jgi:hypothetical protein